MKNASFIFFNKNVFENKNYFDLEVKNRKFNTHCFYIKEENVILQH